MINVSTDFKRNLYAGNNKFLIRLVITLQDNTVLTVENDNIMSNGILVDDVVSEDDDFTALGSTIINACDVTLYNNSNPYSDYEFINAKVVIYVGLNLNGTVEEFKKGTYTVDDAIYGDYTVSLSLVDEMAQFDRPYSESTLTYPATLNSIVLDACSRCNVPLASTSLQFPHRDFSVANRPAEESTTFREVLGWVATIAGCFARCNVDGELELKWFDIDALNSVQTSVYDGGTFNPWTTGNVIDGGSFWSTGDTLDAGEFTSNSAVHYIASLDSQSLGVDDVVITGIRITVEIDDVESDEDIKEFIQGTDDYLIDIDNNEFITVDTAPTILAWLATQLIGTRFRKCNVQHMTDPTIEAGDVALLWDTKGIEHRILVTRVDFSPTSLQTVISGAASVGRNSATRFSNQTKSYVATRRQLREQKDTYDDALEQLEEKVDNASGLYETDVVQQDSSVIKYYHNKPELSESDIQLVISDVGITVTSNGTAEHPTWYGLTVDGNLITSILNTVGINADWIVTGMISDKTGNSYWNLDTGLMNIVGNMIMQYTYGNNTYQARFGLVEWQSGTPQPCFRLLLGDTREIDFYLGTSGYAERLNYSGTPTNFNYSRDLKLRASSTDYRFTETIADKYQIAMKKGSSSSSLFNFVMSGDEMTWKSAKASTWYPRFSATDAMINWETSESNGANFLIRQDTKIVSIQAYYGTSFGISTSSFTISTGGTSVLSYSTNTDLISRGRYIAFQSTSSRRYKHDVKPVEDSALDPHRLYELEVKQFRYHDGMVLQYDDMANRNHVGFIAEEVDEIYPDAVIHHDGQVESWDERRIIPPMLKLIQEQKQKIDELEERIARLEALLLKGE